jgi:hypothetical protein
MFAPCPATAAARSAEPQQSADYGDPRYAYDVVFDVFRRSSNAELWLPITRSSKFAAEIDAGAKLIATATLWPPLDPLQLDQSLYGSGPADGTWPAVAARIAGMHLASLGFGGQCHLDPFVARTLRDADADVITLKVGINVINMDSMRERVFTPQLHGFIDTIRNANPVRSASPIFVRAEQHPGPTVPNAGGSSR